MMSDLKKKAAAFVTGLASGKIDDTLVAPDMTCWASTGGESFGLPRLKVMVGLLKGIFTDDFRITVNSVIAEGDRVAVQAQSTGTLKDGPVYENHYHYALRFHVGRIVEMREYMNSAIVKELIAPRLIAAMSAQKGGT